MGFAENSFFERLGIRPNRIDESESLEFEFVRIIYKLRDTNIKVCRISKNI